MGRINVGRLILGGLVAGIVGDILEYLVDGVWLAPRWADGMKMLGHTAVSSNQVIGFNLLGLATGLVSVWVYVGIRPRFGAGPKTAVLAGLAVWVLGALVPNLTFMCAMGLFSHHLTLYTTLGNLVEMVAGTVAGAALYKES